MFFGRIYYYIEKCYKIIFCFEYNGKYYSSIGELHDAVTKPLYKEIWQVLINKNKKENE